MARIKDRLAALLAYIFSKDQEENSLSEHQKTSLEHHIQLQMQKNTENGMNMQEVKGESDHD